MSTARAAEHANIVLSAVLAGRRDLLERALRHLQPEHFPDQAARNIFIMLQRYYDVTGAVLTRTAFGDLLTNAGADESRVAVYGETFDALLRSKQEDHQFAWSLKALQDERAHELTGKAIASSLEQLQGVVEPPKHLADLQPHARARAVIMEEFARIDRELNMADAPEGDIRTEQREMLEDYAARVANQAAGRTGVMFGLVDLDVRTAGLQNGDLCLIAMYTSQGKSQLAAHMAHNAAIYQGLNVFFATSETIRPQVRRRLVARHSKMDMFNLPEGLNTRDLKAGTLPEHLLPKLQEVINDLTCNPGYGKLHVAQIPRGATVGMLESRLHAAQRSWDIDLVVIDYLALLSPERNRDSHWAEGSDLLKASKQIATTFADGRGVPIVSPWQVSRSAFERAQKTGFYMLSDLSETAEAEKSSDIIISGLRLSDVDTGRRVEMKAQILKNRDGELADAIPLIVDYATSHFTSPQSSQGIASLLDD